jgi:hypothetical protein
MDKPNLNDPEQWLSRASFAAYCGEGSEKLLAYYDKARERRRLIIFHFDWLAVLALPAWLGYRQQWNLWGTLTGLLAAISAAEALLRMQIPNGAFVGTMFGLGMMAHGLLLSNANALYLKLRAQGLPADKIEEALSGRAQAKPLLGVAALAASIAIQVAVVLL